jgi:hypothetical protein
MNIRMQTRPIDGGKAPIFQVTFSLESEGQNDPSERAALEALAKLPRINVNGEEFLKDPTPRRQDEPHSVVFMAKGCA